ncbi:hypothetical protein ACFL6C_11705 [Myxococcota bacterium]
MQTAIGLGLIIVVASGCSAEGGTLLQITHVPTRDSSCNFEIGKFLHTGFYDPRGVLDVAPLGYVHEVSITNRAAVAGEGNQTIDANDAHILGFDACWFRADPESTYASFYEFGGFDSGVPDEVRCENLPDANKRFVASGGTIAAGGAEAIFGVTLLGETVLKGMYGSAFEPENLPAKGVLNSAVVGEGYSHQPADGPEKPRDAGWGEFPETQPARVIVQVRARAKLQSGNNVESNWFVFPVDVCVGCVSDICGMPLLTECPGNDPCPDASSCEPKCQTNGPICVPGEACDTSTDPPALCPLVGECEDGSACTPGDWGLTGSVVGAGSCLPFQAGEASCVSIDGCGLGG